MERTAKKTYNSLNTLKGRLLSRGYRFHRGHFHAFLTSFHV